LAKVILLWQGMSGFWDQSLWAIFLDNYLGDHLNDYSIV
jgi:hypothetical protein